ncbi:MAG: polysaccharide biosynthesis tyrosine autokinase [Bacteroidales bacterium]|nr:polysaccharide biosynthesis tyrosine autokinase [Bacteroidales bacterium]
MAKAKKIPAFNDSFDLSKLWIVVKKNIWIYLLIIAVSIVSAKLYIRYTIPTYETYSIIQINNNEERDKQIVNFTDAYGSASMTNLIELIRSSEFLKRTLQQLNLYTNYFAEGRFVTSELYKRSPFFVEIENPQAHFLNKKIYVNYSAESDLVSIHYEISPDNIYSVEIRRNEWTEINGCRIYVNIISPDSFSSQQTAEYYFINYDENSAFATQFNSLNVSILSYEANTIQVKYTSCNAQKASEIVNTICENFLAYNVEKKQERAEKILQFINEQLEIVYAQLTDSEQKLEEFKKENKITGNILGSNTSTQSTTQEIEKYQSQIKTLNRVNRQIEIGEDFDIMGAISTLSGTSSESMILNFLNGIQQLQKQKEQLLMTLTPDNHKIKVIDSQIEEQKKHLADIIDITNKKLQNDIKTLERLSQSKSNDFNETELTKLKRIHDVHQNFYNQLVEKRAEYLISKAGYVTNNLILQKSSVPETPIAPIASYVIMVCVICCALLIIIITTLCYLFFNQITTINDITQYTDAPISGVIPISNSSDKIHRFVVENKADSVITEAFRTLRSNLEFLHPSKSDKKIIAVTSTISGEGKTFIAINLGGVFALNGKKVILLDLDLRKPKVHLSFNAHNKSGMSTILIGKDSYKDCLIKTDFETFDIIPSGPTPPNPAELANSKAFDELLEELKQEYDIIIIDTPPIGIVSDAIFSFQRADLPIYVSRANYSKRMFINNINYLYGQDSIKNLSVILNSVSIVSSKYGYGYSGYGYGYSGYGYGYGFGYGYYSYDQKSPKKKSFLGKFKKQHKTHNHGNKI